MDSSGQGRQSTFHVSTSGCGAWELLGSRMLRNLMHFPASLLWLWPAWAQELWRPLSPDCCDQHVFFSAPLFPGAQLPRCARGETCHLNIGSKSILHLELWRFAWCFLVHPGLRQALKLQNLNQGSILWQLQFSCIPFWVSECPWRGRDLLTAVTNHDCCESSRLWWNNFDQ